jgi:DNA polymerase III delta subunit
MIKELSLLEFLQYLPNNEPADCYITTGNIPEIKNFIQDSLLQYMISHYKKIAKFTRITINNLPEITNEILTSLLFTLPQIFVIEQLEKLEPKSLTKPNSKKNDLVFFFKNLSSKPKAHIVIFDYNVPQWQWSKNNFLKQYNDILGNTNSILIPCFDISENNISAWIKSFCQINNYQIKEDAVNHIIDNIGNDTGKILKELQKIFTFVLPNKNITAEDVKQFINKNIILTDFQLIESFAKKNLDATINTLLKMKEENITPFEIYRNLRTETEKMLFALEHDRDKLIEMNISSGSAYYLIKRAKNFSVEELRNLIVMLDELDKLMKEDDKIAWDLLFAKIIDFMTQLR